MRRCFAIGTFGAYPLWQRWQSNQGAHPQRFGTSATSQSSLFEKVVVSAQISFDISNTDHVMSVKLLDRVNIICPQPRTTPKMPYEYTKLYAVSRDGYDNCELRNERLIGVCQNAETQSSISIVFRDFSPLPGALEFKPGHSYYIITTSDGSEAGIDKRSGGLCVTKHMKMKFEVHSDRGESSDDYVDHTSAHQRHHTQDHPELSTPLMYIIHTSESSSEHFSTTDDDGGATSSIPSTLTLMLSLLLCVVDGLG